MGKACRMRKCTDCESIADAATEEFWTLINPVMLILADIMEVAANGSDSDRRTIDYEDGWFDLADKISDILDAEGLTDSIENIRYLED